MYDATEVLEVVKNLLNITTTESDVLLLNVINQAYSRILTYTGYKVFPEELNWIVIEIAIRRYNALGSEGIHTELNEGIQFIYERNMLEEFHDELDRFVALNPPTHLKRFRMM